MAEHPLYSTYRSMIARCYSQNHRHFQRYGGRGITVCERWKRNQYNGYKKSEGFKHFLEDMGPKPDGSYTLERRDNDGNYCPENCCWATRKEQQKNRNPYKLPSVQGSKHYRSILSEQDVIEIKTALMHHRRGLVTELAKKYGCSRRTISKIKDGESWGWLTPKTN